MPTVEREVRTGAVRSTATAGQDALDPLGARPVEPLEELPRVGGEGLGVAAVALGVEHVEGERGLAGPGHAGHRGDRADRHADAHALQVVLAGLVDLDEAAGHPPRIAGMGAAGKRPSRSCREGGEEAKPLEDPDHPADPRMELAEVAFRRHALAVRAATRRRGRRHEGPATVAGRGAFAGTSGVYLMVFT